LFLIHPTPKILNGYWAVPRSSPSVPAGVPLRWPRTTIFAVAAPAEWHSVSHGSPGVPAGEVCSQWEATGVTSLWKPRKPQHWPCVFLQVRC